MIFLSRRRPSTLRNRIMNRVYVFVLGNFIFCVYIFACAWPWKGLGLCEQAHTYQMLVNYFDYTVDIWSNRGSILAQVRFFCRVRNFIVSEASYDFPLVRHSDCYQCFCPENCLVSFFFQMTSVDAAIDRRISERRLAGSMAF